MTFRSFDSHHAELEWTDMEIVFGGEPYYGNPGTVDGMSSWYHLKIPGSVFFLPDGWVTVGSAPTISHITGDFKGHFYLFWYTSNSALFWRDFVNGLPLTKANFYQSSIASCALYSINSYSYRVCPH